VVFHIDMKTFDRYISIVFLGGFLLVASVLVSLFSIVELVAQLDDVGKGSYEIKEALLYVALTVPERIGDLMPVSALLGGIIALGLLADRNELLAMQAVGVSVQRIGFSVVGVVILLSVGAGVLGEFVAPPLEQRARTLRSRALSEPGILVTKHGFWARRGNTFIHVGKALPGGWAADLDIYESDEQGRLTGFAHAQAARIGDDDEWLLTNVEQRIISNEGIATQKALSMTIKSFLSTEQVDILELPPASLSVSDLYEYIGVLQTRGQNVDRYALAFWQKLTMPLTTCAMVLLSLPFVFGPPRTRTAGFRITAGLIVGIMFYLANQITGHIGIILDVHPSVTTMVPVAAVLCVAFGLMRRAA
jgi:lipopolysaccharide export system permease protein